MQKPNVIQLRSTLLWRAAWTGLLAVCLATTGCSRHSDKGTSTMPSKGTDNSPPGQGGSLFVGNDWGSEIWIFDTESGAASKALFCVDTKGVNGLNFDNQGRRDEGLLLSRHPVHFPDRSDGKIVAQNLRGEAIKSAVGVALKRE